MRILAMILLFCSCSTLSASDKPLDTVDYVDLDRYLGKWYEIARFEHRFQRNCTATTAEYSMRDDGDIKVLNSCRLHTPDGKLKEAEGRAWVKDTVSNAKLKVQFFLRGIRLPIFAGNYWVLELGEDYEYALVGDKSRKYLWILNRTNQMDEQTYNMLVNKASEKGFDVSKLVKTIH